MSGFACRQRIIHTSSCQTKTPAPPVPPGASLAKPRIAHYQFASVTSDTPPPLATHTYNFGNQVASTLVERGHFTAGEPAKADALLPKLLLSINAIASGLRTTG
jgi:hypothetical protein